MSVVYEGVVQSGTVRTNTPFPFGVAVPASTPEVSRFLTIETWGTIDDYPASGLLNLPTPTWAALEGSYCYPDASLVQDVFGGAGYPRYFLWSSWLARSILPTSTLEFAASGFVGENDYDLNYVIRLWSHIRLVSTRPQVADEPFGVFGGATGSSAGTGTATIAVTDAEYVICSGHGWGFSTSPFGADQVSFAGVTNDVLGAPIDWMIFSGVDTCSAPSYSLSRTWSDLGDGISWSLDLAQIRPGNGIPCDKPSGASVFITSTRQSRWPVSAS